MRFQLYLLNLSKRTINNMNIIKWWHSFNRYSSLFPAFLILVDLGILSSASRGANTNIQQEIENHSRSTIQSSPLSLFKGLLWPLCDCSFHLTLCFVILRITTIIKKNCQNERKRPIEIDCIKKCSRKKKLKITQNGYSIRLNSE